MKASDNSPLKAFGYAYDDSGNPTGVSRATGAAAAKVTTFVPNDRNQVTVMGGPRRQFAQGYTSEPSNVTLNGTRADNADANLFAGGIDAAPGPNTVTAQATDLSANLNTTSQSWDIGVPETQPFAYDANGNLLGDGTRTYGWDAANRLVSVSVGIDTWTFAYDGLDRRVRESKNGVLTRQWVWCGTGICEDRSANGAVSRQYFAHGEPRIGDWDAGDYFHTTDHLGSLRDITTGAGPTLTTVAKYDYDPYGRREKIAGTTPHTADFGFTGHHTHAATGLVLTLYRAYDPELGRWLPPDPIGKAGGMNLFAYVGGSPAHKTDRLGLEPLSDAAKNLAKYYGPGGTTFSAMNHAGLKGGTVDALKELQNVARRGICSSNSVKTLATQQSRLLASTRALRENAGLRTALLGSGGLTGALSTASVVGGSSIGTAVSVVGVAPVVGLGAAAAGGGWLIGEGIKSIPIGRCRNINDALEDFGSWIGDLIYQ